MGEREGTTRVASHGQCSRGKLSEDGRLSQMPFSRERQGRKLRLQLGVEYLHICMEPRVQSPGL